jgi:hypothetical protein
MLPLYHREFSSAISVNLSLQNFDVTNFKLRAFYWLIGVHLFFFFQQEFLNMIFVTKAAATPPPPIPEMDVTLMHQKDGIQHLIIPALGVCYMQ